MTEIEASATIAQLNAETARLQAETARIQAETRVLNAGYGKSFYEVDHLAAQTSKLLKESRWFPYQVIAGIIGGTIAVFGAAAGLLKWLDLFKP
jgi:hypothetical protein